MGERITAIREAVSDAEIGYDVVTTERTIRIRINNGQHRGSMSTPDDTTAFVGASLPSVSTVCEDRLLAANKRLRQYEQRVLINTIWGVTAGVIRRRGGYKPAWSWRRLALGAGLALVAEISGRVVGNALHRDI